MQIIKFQPAVENFTGSLCETCKVSMLHKTGGVKATNFNARREVNLTERERELLTPNRNFLVHEYNFKLLRTCRGRGSKKLQKSRAQKKFC